VGTATACNMSDIMSVIGFNKIHESRAADFND